MFVPAGYYVLTALSTLGSTFYFNYLFFVLRDEHGFGDRGNLWVSVLHGFIYIFSAWQCGRFAERRGSHTSLAVGLIGLTGSLAVGGLLSSAAAELAVLAVYSVVLLFIWPALEALVTQDSPARLIPRRIGLYNCTWAGLAAIAYFAGGSLYDRFGRGAVFWLPASLFAIQLAMLPAIARAARQRPLLFTPPADRPDDRDPRPPHPETFLRLGWLANPLSYVAIYTMLAMMPGIADRLHLSPTQVGWFCSIWLFARLLAFVVLWNWEGWHYRFRWLAGAYVLLVASFVAILLAGSIAQIVIGQAGFGLAAGLIYYSSLFYSMDAGTARAEHGGIHEAAIGLGICAGPAIGALALQAFPTVSGAAAFAVTGLLVVGLGLLVATWIRGIGGSRPMT